MKRIRRVLVATDFSRASSRAFDTAVTIANSTGAHLSIVSVVAPILPAVPEVSLDAVTVDRLQKQAHNWSTRQLKALVDRAKRRGVTARGLLPQGDPVTEIVRTARVLRADVLVLGTHGRRGLKRLILGSVAERVIGLASCPVLTVRGR